jgi:hypothetical protein
MRILRGVALLAAAGLTGCGGQLDLPSGAPAAPPPRLGDHTTIDLKRWLQKPRPELAQLVTDWTGSIQKQRLHALENPQSLALLPGLQPPGTTPVFESATYSEKAGFSLPPYLPAGQTDAAVALHLARLGDREAALKAADPADKDLRNRIDAQSGEHSYPLEWTQLTALAFQSAEWRLASDDADAAADLVQMHKQLRALLDAKAAAGPLGGTLLPLGRRALAEAAEAWRKGKPTLADDVKAALKGWGEAPPPDLPLAPGAGQSEAARLIGAPPVGRAIAVVNPKPGSRSSAVGRALDLLELPAPSDGVQAVAAFFDGDRRLTETIIFYEPRINQTFPEPINLAHYLANRALQADDSGRGVGLARQVWSAAGLKYEAAVLTRGNALGGYVRITGARADTPLPADARDFGAVRLDRTYEQNRVRFARYKNGPSVDLNCTKSPGVVRLPAGVAAPGFATLESEKDLDVTAALTFSWPDEELAAVLTNVAAPLLGAFGSPRIDGVQTSDGDCLALIWEDARTRVTLRLPYESDPAMLRAENVPGAESAETRHRAAEAYDKAERKGRLDAGKPLRWVPRWLQLPDVQLGMTKKQVQDVLPHKNPGDVMNLGGDLSLFIRDAPAADATYYPWQMFLRFGSDGRLAEVRVRYADGPARPDDRHPSLLGVLKQAGGEPQPQSAPWAGLWTDLPPQEPKPALYRWADDLTVLTCQRDGGGSEAIVRDRPAGATVDEAETALPPLRFCDDGASGVRLGQTRADVLKTFPENKALDGEDAVAFAARADSPYETLAVWFDADKVVRVVAQHKAKPADAGDVPAKLQAAWTRDFERLGAPRRQEGPSGRVLQALGWHDDRIRVRTAAQDTPDGPRLFTEWRYWPVTVK